MWGLYPGSSYFFGFIDDYSKSQVFNIFNRWKVEKKVYTRRKLKYIKIKNNNMTEFKYYNFLEYCKNKGIT